jgi:rhamnosyltransferase
MRSLLAECCIVCNGYVNEEGRAWLKANSDYLFFRENDGYDAGAYQDVILNGLGISKLHGFDELVLLINNLSDEKSKRIFF